LFNQLDRQPYLEAKDRIPGVNILSKVVDKLSKIYMESPTRDAEVDSDQALYDWYSKSMQLNSHMHDANQFFNLFKNTALEPYLEEGKPRIRVIPSHQFLVKGDDLANPTKPTVFIKFMGDRPGVDPEGNPNKVAIFWLYTADEFLAIDASGEIVREDMADNPEGINPFGVIPFIYINRSRYKILPNPDTDFLRMTILIPVLLSDLNFAAKYQTFSIVYGIDVDTENLAMSPNAMWLFKSDSQGVKPEVGTIKPNADIDKMIVSIQNQLGMWFETRNLKATTVGNAQIESAASGISLMIQNLDTSDDRKVQTRYFEEAEHMLWRLIADHMHPVWIDSAELDNSPSQSFSSSEIEIKYAEQRPLKSDTEILDNAIRKLDEALITKELALREIYPDMTTEQIEVLMASIEEDQSMELPPMPEEEVSPMEEGEFQAAPETEESAERPDDLEGEGLAPKEVLNGAQVTSMVGVVEKVSLGQLPRASGINILIVAFGLTAEEAEAVIGDAGAGFEPEGQDGPPEV